MALLVTWLGHRYHQVLITSDPKLIQVPCRWHNLVYAIFPNARLDVLEICWTPGTCCGFFVHNSSLFQPPLDFWVIVFAFSIGEYPIYAATADWETFHNMWAERICQIFNHRNDPIGSFALSAQKRDHKVTIELVANGYKTYRLFNQIVH